MNHTIVQADCIAFEATGSAGRACLQCHKAFLPRKPCSRFCGRSCCAKWVSTHRKARHRTTSLRAHLICRSCGADWDYHGHTNLTTCPFCGKVKNATISAECTARQKPRSRDSLEQWNSVPSNRKQRAWEGRMLLRKRVLFKVSGTISPRCVRCGCDDIRLLEVNHKNGGGNREHRFGKGSMRFYLDIASGKRAADDLELLCRPCNSIHYLESKFGSLPMKVVWNVED